jgi:hypothetical protein
MPDIELSILPGTLIPGVCFPDEQTRLVAFAQNMRAILSGSAFYSFGANKPAAEFQGYPWLRSTDMQWYYFAGKWKRPRALADQDPNTRRLYVGTPADLITYDGGSAGPVSADDGPMWEVDTDFDGRSPMGVGAIPQSDPAKTLALDEAYGDGSIVQGIAQMPAHTHGPKTGFASFSGFVAVGQPSSYEIEGGTEIEKMDTTGVTGGSQPMSLVHPVRGCYIIKPTARLNYVIP